MGPGFNLKTGDGRRGHKRSIDQDFSLGRRGKDRQRAEGFRRPPRGGHDDRRLLLLLLLLLLGFGILGF